MNNQKLIEQMTLEEKAGLCSGKDMWHFKGIERLNIPELMVCDGPHGLRKQDTEGLGANLDESVDAICFPLACATAATWNKDALAKLGDSIGKEALAEKVDVVLGPGNNIKRSPLGGRNFEYFSEDPFLAGKLAASFIKAEQKNGVGTSLKHYCANNNETYRMSISSIVDERTLREIYLAAFEIAVKEAQPTTVMCAYNKINDIYASENKKILWDILREEWGFKGLVVTDWGATNNRVEGVKSGCDVEMPSSGGMNDKLIVEAVKNGTLDEKVLDENVDRIVSMILKLVKARKDSTYSKDEHYDIAKSLACEGAVLLKNDKNILPLNSSEKYLLVGEMAEKPRFQGAGSSFINCTKISTMKKCFEENNINFEYVPGYDMTTDDVKQKLIDEAVAKAKDFENIIVVCGLPKEYEAEGFDRKTLDMPKSHIALVEALSKLNKKVTIVLNLGAPVALPFNDDVHAILCAYLGGQAGADACCDVLFGKVSPSGRLPETWPINYEDIPSSKYFPGRRFSTEYREGLYVGYRYFNKVNAPVLYPFGFGLSYTDFEFSNITISKDEIKDSEKLIVTCDVKNIGNVESKEVVQLYVKDIESTVYTTAPQLKGFEKISLKPNETKTVSFELDKRSFAFYNVDAKDWQVETGDFEIQIGKSSRDIVLTKNVKVVSTDTYEITPTPSDSWYVNPDASKLVSDEDYFKLMGRKVEYNYRIAKKGEFTPDDSFEDMAATSGLARFAVKIAKSAIKIAMKVKDPRDPNFLMIYEVMKTSPLRSLAFSSQGMFNMKMVDGVVQIMNGHFFKGLHNVIKHIKG